MRGLHVKKSQGAPDKAISKSNLISACCHVQSLSGTGIKAAPCREGKKSKRGAHHLIPKDAVLLDAEVRHHPLEAVTLVVAQLATVQEARH